MIYSVSKHTEVPFFFMDKMMEMIRNDGADYQIKNSEGKLSTQRINLSMKDTTGLVFWSKNWEHYFQYQEEIENKYRVVYNHSAPLLPVELSSSQFFSSIDEEIAHLGEAIDIFRGRLNWHLQPILLTDITPPEYYIEIVKDTLRTLFGEPGSKVAPLRSVVIQLFHESTTSGPRMASFEYYNSVGYKPLDWKSMAEFINKLAKIFNEYQGLNLESCMNPFLVVHKSMKNSACVSIDHFTSEYPVQGDGLRSPLASYNETYKNFLNRSMYGDNCKCSPSVDLGLLFDPCPGKCIYCSEMTGLDVIKE